MLGGDPLEDMLPIETLEQHGQFLVPLPHGVQILLKRAQLLAQLFTVLLIDAGPELPLLHPGRVGHPRDIIQHNFIQLVFLEMVRRTRSLAPVPVGVVREIVFHCVGPMGHHGLTSVGVEDQPREDTRLLHLFRDALFVLPHILQDVPKLLDDQRRVGVRYRDLLIFRPTDQLLVFVGERGGQQIPPCAEVIPAV